MIEIEVEIEIDIKIKEREDIINRNMIRNLIERINIKLESNNIERKTSFKNNIKAKRKTLGIRIRIRKYRFMYKSVD